MRQPGERFPHRWTGQLEHLHKNVYLNRSDPLYYEKLLRYSASVSPEAHYRLGQKYEREGKHKKAAEHYRQSMRQRSSDFAVLAARALRRLETGQAGESQERYESATTVRTSRFPVRTLAVLLALLLMLSVFLIVLTLRLDNVSATLSGLKIWGVGKNVTHESVELPYVLYFPYSASEKEIEDKLYKESLELGRSNPGQAVLVYGLAGEYTAPEQHAVPMTNPDAAAKAFAVAQYQSDLDRTVRIRFLNKEFRNLKPLTEVGANLVRTALQAYVDDHGEAPPDIRELVADYPANYLSFIPVEPISNSDRIVSVYDGTGGWVYRSKAEEPGTMFVPNVPGLFSLQDQQRFRPLRLLVDKQRHMLQLLMGDDALLQTPVGLGADGATPVGTFRVAERVLEPAGSKPGVYGAAAFGLGDIAVHGTLDEASIGRDASHGCIRVADAEMSALYPFVPKGTKVQVVERGEAIAASPAVSNNVWEALVPEMKYGKEERARGKHFYWLG